MLMLSMIADSRVRWGVANQARRRFSDTCLREALCITINRTGVRASCKIVAALHD